MGIYWVYFTTHSGDEMKLVIHSEKADTAIINIAKFRAARMSKDWIFDRIEVCR